MAGRRNILNFTSNDTNLVRINFMLKYERSVLLCLFIIYAKEKRNFEERINSSFFVSRPPLAILPLITKLMLLLHNSKYIHALNVLITGR